MEDMKRDLGTTCRLEADVVVDLQGCSPVERPSLLVNLRAGEEQPHMVDFEWSAVLVLRAVHGDVIHSDEQRATQQLAGEQHWSRPASSTGVRAAQGQSASSAVRDDVIHSDQQRAT